jgi:hypothetical protein
LNPSLYYNGRQIKNYLIGFASLFSEIPYMKRNGTIGIIPIVYGSSSDVISYLENNVDNLQTKNRNRLKDLTIPLFSFRLTNLQRNIEKRRAIYEDIVVDLRSMGYSSGYVSLYPAPFEFTFELSLWASSDNQLFEIMEQILPYFNSSQQVTIEPLPKCPVSKSEINLSNLEVETDPESNKYSAQAIFEFQVSGWLLAQPKIWNTDMQFELRMLDSENKNLDLNKPEFDKYSFGKEIYDMNTVNPYEDKRKEEIASIKNFIKMNENIKKTYLKTYKIYKKLVEMHKINDKTDKVINYDKVEIDIDDEKLVIESDTYDYIVDKIKDLKYLYENTKLKYKLSKNTFRNEIDVLLDIGNDKQDLLKYFFILLDNEYINTSFNKTGVEFTNSDKLKFFGTMRIDIDFILDRLTAYQSSFDWIKTQKEKVKDYLNENPQIYYMQYILKKFNNDKLPSDIKQKIVDELKIEISDIKYDIDKFVIEQVQKSKKGYEFTLINDDIEEIYVFNYDKSEVAYEKIKNEIVFKIELENISKNKNNGLVVLYKKGEEWKNFVILFRVENNAYDEKKFENIKIKSLFGVKLEENDIKLMLKDFYNFSNELKILDTKFIETEKQILINLFVQRLIKENRFLSIDDLVETLKNDDEEFKLFVKHYGNVDNIYEIYAQMTKLIRKLDILVYEEDNQGKISKNGIAQKELKDKKGRRIYDVNQDGVVDKKDLKILHSDVDDPEKYNFRVEDDTNVNNVGKKMYYQNFVPSKMTKEQVKKVKNSIKTIYFMLMMDEFDIVKKYFELYGKKLLSDDFYLPSEKEKLEEIKMLGYDLKKMDEDLSFLKLIVDSIKTILIDYKYYLIYVLKNVDEELIDNIEKSDFDVKNIMLGLALKKYLSTITDGDKRLLEEIELRKILNKNFSIYELDTRLFDEFWFYIRKNEYFYESLREKDEWLERTYPHIEEKVEKLLEEKKEN